MMYAQQHRHDARQPRSFFLLIRTIVELLRALASGHAGSIGKVPQEQIWSLRKMMSPMKRRILVWVARVQSELLA